jgi:thiol-disulfide isomerase/thioredoxin
MHFFNHYSAPIVAGLLLVISMSVVLRRGGKIRDWLILGGVTSALVVAWLCLRPTASGLVDSSGRPVLLEVQSPYCLGCIAVKSAVDRLENEWRNKLVVRRMDIQSADGQRLVTQFGIEVTPTFIFFDAAGKERWRSAGELDAAQVRASLEKHNEAR